MFGIRKTKPFYLYLSTQKILSNLNKGQYMNGKVKNVFISKTKFASPNMKMVLKNMVILYWYPGCLGKRHCYVLQRRKTGSYWRLDLRFDFSRLCCSFCLVLSWVSEWFWFFRFWFNACYITLINILFYFTTNPLPQQRPNYTCWPFIFAYIFGQDMYSLT